MEDVLVEKGNNLDSLRRLLKRMEVPFSGTKRVGIKTHWGEKENTSFLPPLYVREIAHWLKHLGCEPFVFDTTVLYSGSRRDGKRALQTAYEHGYCQEYLGCPVIIADGFEGRDVVDIPAPYKHFSSVQVASLINDDCGFVVFSHFKGHLAASFGGAVKNISMGFASRAQKQRMHADVKPELEREKCTRCGTCIALCPSKAATFGDDGFPVYDYVICLGCAQCIALCPELALKIIWGEDQGAFQEKLIETAAALWKKLKGRTIFINALIHITSDCDCLEGDHPVIAPDFGFVGGYHPMAVDEKSLKIVGTEPFEKAHPHLPWQRQFAYADEIGFYPEK